jgi:hypothetical protein
MHLFHPQVLFALMSRDYVVKKGHTSSYQLFQMEHDALPDSQDAVRGRMTQAEHSNQLSSARKLTHLIGKNPDSFSSLFERVSKCPQLLEFLHAAPVSAPAPPHAVMQHQPILQPIVQASAAFVDTHLQLPALPKPYCTLQAFSADELSKLSAGAQRLDCVAFGQVIQAQIQDGTSVTIKLPLRTNDSLAAELPHAGMATIGGLQHESIIKLLGFGMMR